MTGDEKTVRLSRSELKSLVRGRSAKARADDGTTVRIRPGRGLPDVDP
jgi:hypothetical protein